MDTRREFPSEVENAIFEAIEAETRAYAAKDFEAWSQCWVHSEMTSEALTGPQGTVVYRGWNNVSKAMEKVMSDDPAPLPLPFRHQGFQFHVEGNLALVTFLSTCQVTGFEEFDAPDSFETRVLRRDSGKWRIIYASVLALRSGPVDRDRVRVDDRGRILWAAPKTLESLRDHPCLTVSAGHLRATRPVWDKILQTAIRRSAKLHHVFQLETSPLAEAARAVFPVVLGEDDDGGVQSCMVYVRDGGTYVAFDDGHAIERRLATAEVIFGLSEAQTRLATLIVQGLGLTQAARDLGISVNTARTHLSRIFDKTGVHSQVALVRVLLSFDALGD